MAASNANRVENPIENIESDFSGITTELEGGSIYNTIEAGVGGINISANFLHNQGSVHGGAIFNSSSLNTISGRFTENYAKVPNASSTPTLSMGGGAIYNSGHISNIFDSTFEGNYASDKTARTEAGERQGGDAYAYGGAIFNTGTIGTKDAGDSGIIDTIFKDNFANESGGAIFNHADGEIRSISGQFEHNYVANSARGESGGAIYNMGKIGTIAADFKENFVKNPLPALYGGAIYNSGEITSIQAHPSQEKLAEEEQAENEAKKMEVDLFRSSEVNDIIPIEKPSSSQSHCLSRFRLMKNFSWDGCV